MITLYTHPEGPAVRYSTDYAEMGLAHRRKLLEGWISQLQDELGDTVADELRRFAERQSKGLTG